MLSYKNDLTKAEQTKLDALIVDTDMTYNTILMIDETFEVVDKELFDKMNKEVFNFHNNVTDIHYCELTRQWASCATLMFADNTVYHVDAHLAVCIYNGEFIEISLDE